MQAVSIKHVVEVKHVPNPLFTLRAHVASPHINIPFDQHMMPSLSLQKIFFWANSSNESLQLFPATQEWMKH